MAFITQLPGTPASYVARFAASLLDGFILVALSVPVGMLTGGSQPFAITATFALTLAYFTYGHSSQWQATPGKRILRLYVTDARGQRLTRRCALERTLAYLLPFLPQYSSLSPDTSGMLVLWLAIVWFMPIFYTRQRTGLHDLLCGTRVVNGLKGE